MPVEVADPVTVGGDHHRLVLAEFDGVAGVFDECRNIGADDRVALRARYFTDLQCRRAAVLAGAPQL
jgi:hypothetical protein